MDQCPIQGELKTLIRLTLQKTEISDGSMGHWARKGFSQQNGKCVTCVNYYYLFNPQETWSLRQTPRMTAKRLTEPAHPLFTLTLCLLYACPSIVQSLAHPSQFEATRRVKLPHWANLDLVPRKPQLLKIVFYR